MKRAFHVQRPGGTVIVNKDYQQNARNISQTMTRVTAKVLFATKVDSKEQRGASLKRSEKCDR